MPESKPIVIYGAGGQGRVVLDILRSVPGIVTVGFLDSDENLHGSMVDNLRVLGDMRVVPGLLTEYPGIASVVAIGDNRARMDIARQLSELGMPLVNAIHPRAFISPSAHIGRNVTVASGAIICAHVRIGDHVIVNTGAIIEHENNIGDGVHIAPGAKLAGRVTVDRGAFVGIGAVVIGNLRIGTDAVVGAGAVVLHDVEPSSVVAGVPARPIQPKAKGG
ncbi:MAG: acetyltransferase [Firmicutes bacterium]|nr:acetyltransferase [Bacillota bacterium]